MYHATLQKLWRVVQVSRCDTHVENILQVCRTNHKKVDYLIAGTTWRRRKRVSRAKFIWEKDKEMATVFLRNKLQ